MLFYQIIGRNARILFEELSRIWDNAAEIFGQSVKFVYITLKKGKIYQKILPFLLKIYKFFGIFGEYICKMQGDFI